MSSIATRFRTLSALLPLCVVLTLFLFIAPDAQAAPFAYITNTFSNNVSVIDTASNTVTSTIALGNRPDGVAVNTAGTQVYVANSNDGTVSVIDTASNTVVATVTVGTTPLGVAVNPAGTRAYVANNGSGTVSVIDTASNTVIATVAGQVNPLGVAVNPAGTRVYVANSSLANSVQVIDTASNTVTAIVAVGSNPTGVVVNPAGTRVYVANGSSSGSVSVIDTASDTTTATVVVGDTPDGVAVNPAGTRVYAANYVSGTVSVIDTASNTVVASVAVGTNPAGVAVNPAGTRAYVANAGSNTVSVIDTASNTVVASVAVGAIPSAFGQFIIGAGAPPTPPTITNGPPPNGTIGLVYSFTYTSTGAPTFSVTGGSLPPGLNLSAAGVISGTPTTIGTFSGTVTASNGAAPDATQNFSITIVAVTSPPTITNGPPPNGTIGVVYSFTYTSTGAPTFSVTAGSLPPGLNLSAAGVISGTPTTIGTFSGTVTAANGTAPDATQNFSITIVAVGPPPSPSAIIPTLSGWGMICLFLLIIGVARFGYRRKGFVSNK